MKRYEFEEARALISDVCRAADDGQFDRREAFMKAIDRKPEVAVQGYNQFGKIFHWNTASFELYGYREEDAVNRDLVELILPPEMRLFARDAIATACRTGRMPSPGPCDLMRADGTFVTVYSGHVVFQWEHASSPEFYCLDVALDSDE